MKVLLTGASGVIGLPLAIKHAQIGNMVYLTYNRSSVELQNALNQKGYSEGRDYVLVPYSGILSQSDQYNGYFDEVWHFATYGQPIRAIDNCLETVRLNCIDTATLCGFVKASGTFFYASTSEVYGASLNATELSKLDSDPSSRRATYTESKRVGEAVLNTLIPERSVIFRICLTYSEYAKAEDRRVLYEFIRQARTSSVIKLLDAGSAMRQYCHADDAIEMMLRVRELSFTSGSSGCGVWNIANPETVSIRDLAMLIGELTCSEVVLGRPDSKGVLDALPVVSVVPSRFLKAYPDFVFTSLEDGLRRVLAKI